MSEHSAKRLRLTGSFSPASPPYHQSAQPLDQTKPVIHPNTPTSPPYPPMSSHSHGAPFTAHPASIPEMTPPSSVAMSQQPSSAASASNAALLATPNSTVGGASSSLVDSDGDALMRGASDDETDPAGDHRRSDHDRQGGKLSARDTVAGSQLFKLCQRSHPASRPHSSVNMFELYGLNDLALSVARYDPNTGEKINKLRKSYEGQIKAMQIAGKPKAVKMEGTFMSQLAYPDEHTWMSNKVAGHEYHTAIDLEKKELVPDFNALLNNAFAGMTPGPLPSSDAQRYRQYLGTDDTAKPKAVADAIPRQRASASPAPVNSGFASRMSRPERSGAKRSYTDVSFQGYGEGFTDDGYGGDSDGQGELKRRKLGFPRTSQSVEVGGQRR